MRYFACCDYDGRAFAGWQRQVGQDTVQEIIEKSLSIFNRQTIEITGCGRTDAGVSGHNYVFHFDLDQQIDPAEFLYKCNQLLPVSIAITRIEAVADEMHARFSALSRYYIYRIHGKKLPLERHYSWYYPYLGNIDVNLLTQVSNILLDTSHFGSFCKSNGNNKTNECHILRCDWEVSPDHLMLHIEADRFLRCMVRLITGASLNIAAGKMSLSEFQAKITKEEILPHAWSVPAHGLTFEGVKYDTGFFQF